MFCMAVWLTGTIAMSLVATQNFRTIDRLLANSPSEDFHQAVQQLDAQEGAATGREFLRYLSSELNRLYFQWWNFGQLLVGGVVLWLVRPLPGEKRTTWCVVSMLGIGLFLAVVLTPYIVSIGREIDFVPRNPPPSSAVSSLRTFAMLHSVFAVFTLIELILGGLVTFWIQRTPES
jgi:hypothetical protein